MVDKFNDVLSDELIEKDEVIEWSKEELADLARGVEKHDPYEDFRNGIKMLINSSRETYEKWKPRFKGYAEVIDEKTSMSARLEVEKFVYKLKNQEGVQKEKRFMRMPTYSIDWEADIKLQRKVWLKKDERILLLSKPNGQEICLHQKFVWVGDVEFFLTDWDGKTIVSHLDLWQLKIVLEEFNKALDVYESQKSDEKSKAFLAYMDWSEVEDGNQDRKDRITDHSLLADAK